MLCGFQGFKRLNRLKNDKTKSKTMNRKNFLKKTASSAALLGIAPSFAISTYDLQEDPVPIDVKIVKEFVAAGHKDLNKVKEMLAAYPNLIYAKYDWGNSDFEEAIEGAGHLGQKEIANYLISQGARVNLFVLTMLGHAHLVIPTLDMFPELIYAKGPHGFTLLHHARVGGSSDLEDYLLDKGLDKTFIKIK
jgi:hypothetical protein